MNGDAGFFGERGRLGYNSVVLDLYTQIHIDTVFIVYTAYTLV